MPSEVDIANLSLSHLGDDATVSSLDPPEGSAQAEHCATFYPIARDTVLELHDWGFNTRRISPAASASTIPEWAYAYALPSEALRVISVLPPGATDDYSAPPAGGVLVEASGSLFSPQAFPAVYQPQPFAIESLDDGTIIVYTNQADASVRYTKLVTDPTKFSPLCTTAISWLLSSYVAGPLIKGEAGAAEAERCLKMFELYISRAKTSDANQKYSTTQHSVPWMAGR